MSKQEINNIIEKAAKEYGYFIGGKNGWDYDNSKVNGLLCQGISISFYLYVKYKYNITINIFQGLFLTNEFVDDILIHYWCEYDNLIIDFSISQFQEEIESIKINNIINYGDYIFKREDMNLIGTYIKQETNQEKIFEKISPEFNYFSNSIKNKKENETILEAMLNN